MNLLYPYMNKRGLFLAELQENETLQKQKDIATSNHYTDDCNFCGACTILCPTDAMKMETENMTAHPSHFNRINV